MARLIGGRGRILLASAHTADASCCKGSADTEHLKVSTGQLGEDGGRDGGITLPVARGLQIQSFCMSAVGSPGRDGSRDGGITLPVARDLQTQSF